MIAIGRAAAALALMLAVSARPVAAQEVAPEACDAIREQIRYLVNEGAFIREAGLKEGVDLLGNAVLVRNAACSTPGDESVPTPAAQASPPTLVLTPPTPVAAPATPTADEDNSSTRRDACLLVTEKEVGTAMQQGVVANEADPAGTSGAQGCEFNGVAEAFTDVMYFQASGSVIYDEFHATAETNGVQAVPGLGDRAFSYVGGNGPGVVVAKGDKLFTLEFSGIGDGPSERSSLLVLAQQALGRVH